MDKLYIVMPAYNEEINIESVAKEWHKVLENIDCDETSKLIIINDGSTDSTYTKLVELKKCLPHLEPITKVNSGHGATILYGYQYALDHNADFVFQTDSDGQTLSTEFYNFWNKRKDYPVIVGNRKQRQDGVSRVFVTKILKLIIHCIFGQKIEDANSPYRLIKREILVEFIPKIPMNFNLTNILLLVLIFNAKKNVKFLQITFRPRQGGKNSINLKKIVKIGIQATKDFARIKDDMISIK